ncbi:glycosyltransferase family 4 protein [Ramlibacter tataouinensis]|uniref:glycosyltransferase family 4 protein n=1 Tax=Ramlibacter tataouinensis TaxID=94132 RepID=UPI0022F3EDD4|nr:glycosyltransferase family 4 protein [Ramlibacter tataouinensis]WBY01279.1 glycosyltransferase family 4 protein [Ramlibacter tataouinensis]
MTRPMDRSSTLDLPSRDAGETRAQPGRFIYIAVPWTPVGGGMFKVADYLIQSQAAAEGGPVLRPLDTRGSGNAAASLLQVLRAVVQLARARLGGQLAGVHVNMAERLDFVRESLVLVACRALGIPTVLHLHAAQLHHSYARLPRPLQALVRWIFSLPRACVVLGQVSAAFVTRDLRVPAERVEVVINGVPDPAVPRRRAREREAFQVLFVGNLSERKGVADLLQALAQPALARLPLRLTLAGGGDTAGYAAHAERLRVAHRVHFHGWADQAQLGRLLAEADALVLPSYDEGLPLAILEALAHGVAVVCTPVGEIPHVLAHLRDAVFVEPGDPASIARGLGQVLAEPELRERLEHNGRALHEARFSLARFSAAIARIHQRHFGLSAQSAPAPDAPAQPRGAAPRRPREAPAGGIAP